MQVCSSS